MVTESPARCADNSGAEPARGQGGAERDINKWQTNRTTRSALAAEDGRPNGESKLFHRDGIRRVRRRRWWWKRCGFPAAIPAEGDPSPVAAATSESGRLKFPLPSRVPGRCGREAPARRNPRAPRSPLRALEFPAQLERVTVTVLAAQLRRGGGRRCGRGQHRGAGYGRVDQLADGSFLHSPLRLRRRAESLSHRTGAAAPRSFRRDSADAHRSLRVTEIHA